MTEPISVVVLSTGLENFKDIRRALSAEERVKLLAGGNDTDQLYEEIVRLKPAAAIIALHGANAWKTSSSTRSKSMRVSARARLRC